MPRRTTADPTPSGVWALTVSTAELAGIFDVTSRRILQLEEEGVLRRNDHNQWPLARSFQALLAHRLRQEADDQADTEEGRRLRDLKADEIALRIEERSGALIAEARAEAMVIIDEFGGMLQSDMLAIPARVTKDLALRGQIETEIRNVFGAASRRAAAENTGGGDGQGHAPPMNRQARRKANRVAGR